MATPSLTGMTVEELNANGLRIHNEIINGNYPVNGFLSLQEEVNGKGAPNYPDATDRLIPAEFGDHSDPTELITGYEPINLNVRQVFDQHFRYQWWFVTYPVVISSVEQDKNAGKERIFDLQKKRIENVQRAAFRRLERHMLSGAESGHSRLNTLNGIDWPTGYFEAAAPGAQSHSIGGLSKSSYYAYPLLENQYYNCAGSVNANGIEALEQIQAQIGIRSTEPDSPAGWIMSPNARAAFGRLAKATVVTQATEKQLNLLMPDIIVGNARIRMSPYMPLTGTTSATTKVSGYRIAPKHQPLCYMKDRYFNMDEWRFAQGTKTIVCQIDTVAQFMPTMMATAAVLSNAESY